MDYSRGIVKLIDYLYSLGHRRIGFVGHHAILGPINEGMRAVVEAVARIPSLEVRTAANADTLEGGRLATRALLSSAFRPTAIVCVNDFTAVGALRELRERGLRVPEDVSVTGFDNVKISEFCCPAPVSYTHLIHSGVPHSSTNWVNRKPLTNLLFEQRIQVFISGVLTHSKVVSAAPRKTSTQQVHRMFGRTDPNCTVGAPGPRCLQLTQ